MLIVARVWPDTTLFDVRDAHVMASVSWIPALSVWKDKDSDEINEGIEFDADLHSGHGVAAKIALGDAITDVGLMIITTRHEEHESGSAAQLDGIFLEAAHRYFWGEYCFGELAGGLGGLIFELPDRFRSGDGMAFLIRGALGVEYLEHIRLQLGVGYFRWGHPGETYGDGTYVEIGGALLF